jgi:hypothetical protein
MVILRQYRHDEISSESTLVDALSALLRVTVTVLPFAIFKQFLINKKAKYQQKTLLKVVLSTIARTHKYKTSSDILRDIYTTYEYFGSRNYCLF